MPRVLIERDPGVDGGKYLYENSPWNAQWVGPRAWDNGTPVVYAFRKRFSLDRDATVRVHVSADERYRLFVDGRPVGRGPERGDLRNWFYETYDLPLAAGEHTFVARVWRLGDLAPYAQVSVRPAFFLMAEGELRDRLTTGVAEWEFRQLDGYSFTPQQLPHTFMVVGPASNIHGDRYDFDHHSGGGDGWQPAPAIMRASVKALDNEWRGGSLPLRPAVLPPMLDTRLKLGVVRSIEPADQLELRTRRVEEAGQLTAELAGWNAMLAGGPGVTIPARTGRRVIIDLQNYYCLYPHYRVSGGRGATVQYRWTESLADSLKSPDAAEHKISEKGNRDQVFGKFFHGIGGAFYPEGGQHRTYDTLWWNCGRYVELTILTADQPLTIDAIDWHETHYPFTFQSRFEASDPKLAGIIPIALRTLEMCGHETYFDCPYYEQLMYVGDTRLEVLTTYATTADDRLPRKAIELFDESRDATGLTTSRTPSRTKQRIPTFSLWWIGMLHDYAMWRDDAAFVHARLPGARSVINAYLQHRRPDGLVASPAGWNFVDWVPGWPSGMPKGQHTGPGAISNLQLIYALRQLADLEDAAGEPELAARCRRVAGELQTAARRAFFDDARGLYADDLEHTSFSEHAQCLAILANAVADADRPRVIAGLLNAESLHRTTIYFSHYLFETFTAINQIDRLFARLPLWFDLVQKGLKTTVESPEPTRSDCHAWGAHPVYHYYASILGIRPAAAGFKAVTIRPQLGPLEWARGSLVHPAGMIEMEVHRTAGRLTGRITLPAGVQGTLIANGESRPITGEARIELTSPA